MYPSLYPVSVRRWLWADWDSALGPPIGERRDGCQKGGRGECAREKGEEEGWWEAGIWFCRALKKVVFSVYLLYLLSNNSILTRNVILGTRVWIVHPVYSVILMDRLSQMGQFGWMRSHRLRWPQCFVLPVMHKVPRASWKFIDRPENDYWMALHAPTWHQDRVEVTGVFLRFVPFPLWFGSQHTQALIRTATWECFLILEYSGILQWNIVECCYWTSFIYSAWEVLHVVQSFVLSVFKSKPMLRRRDSGCSVVC